MRRSATSSASGLRRALAASLAVAFAAGCSGGGGPADDQEERRARTFVFGAAIDPVSLDGALVSDRDSLRVVRQIFEGLVAFAPGTTRVVPSLATRWRARDGGRIWSFWLRRGVRFHDGARFGADAVCANFERWYRLPHRDRGPDTSYYWQRVFGGFQGDSRPSLYRGCRVRSRHRVDLLLTRASRALLPALALPSFGLARGTTGTGPFRLDEWAPGNVILKRNNRYWGRRPWASELVFRSFGDPYARRQALASRYIDAYDVASVAELPGLGRERGVRLLERLSLNVSYVGVRRRLAPVVRRALAAALDREAVVRTQYGGRAIPARALAPPALLPAPGAVPARYDPAAARRLLRRAGLRLPVRIRFWYPTNITRPYMPDPPGLYRVLARGLERSGFQVLARPAPWLPDYHRAVARGEPEVYLSGSVADIPEPGAFVRSLDLRGRYLGIPLAHSFGLVAVSQRVRGYVPSPIGVESLAPVRVG